MIAQIRGRLVEKTPTYVVVDCGGVGYQLHISLHTYSRLKDEENCMLHAHLVVREDAQILYGFTEASEKKLFQLLISVSGVGPATGIMVLSSADPSEIRDAIVSGNVDWFKSVKGIGPKTAQRLIIDLKDKLTKENIEGSFSDIGGNTVKEEALSALVMLGFNKNQAGKSIDKILRSAAGSTVEEVIKNALKGL